MPTKSEALAYIKDLAGQQVLTKAELITAFDSVVVMPTGSTSTPPPSPAGASSGRTDTATETNPKLGIAEILYYLGGGIVFLGIVILVEQNWSSLSFPSRLLATLGSAIAAYVIGVLLSRNQRTEPIALSFYLISGLVMPIGLYVIFNNAGINLGDPGVQSLIATLLTAMYLASYLALRKTIFAFFTIVFATMLVYSLANWLLFLGGNIADTYEYLALCVGASYILLGCSLAKNQLAALRGFLYGFGILSFLGSALALGGWSPNQNLLWELFFPVLVFATLFASVYLKSKAFLVWGTIFLMLYILKITAEYFSGGLGWPFALVVAGLGMIGAGYLSVSINRHYLKPPA